MAERITGTGITKQKRESFDLTTTDGLAEARPWLDKFFSQDFTFEGLHGKPLEALCRKILKDTGLAAPNAELAELAKLPVALTDPDSEAGYAVRVLQKLTSVRAIIAQGDIDTAVRCGIEIGSLVTEAHLKNQWESFALSGQKKAKDLSRARDSYNDQRGRTAAEKYKKWDDRALVVWQKIPLGAHAQSP